MTKDVKICVKGYQKDADGNENSDTTEETGLYYEKENLNFVIIENAAKKQSARYKFNHRFLEIVRNGELDSKLYFEGGKEYVSNYITPYGQMLLNFKTKSFSIEQSEKQIEITVCYDLFHNEKLLSENKTVVTIAEITKE